jgi:hypothetical protein
MKRGFSAAGPVIARCCNCNWAYGARGTRPPWEFASIDEAMDFFVDGADGFELYGDRLFCPNCLHLSACYDPGHDWYLSVGPFTGGRTLMGHQCTVCGLFVAEVLP